MNKDLLLREKLAIQRTYLANQTTLLAFIRTSMYFLVAGLSMRNLIQLDNPSIMEFGFFTISGIILLVGLYNYRKNQRITKKSEIHVGDFKLEYLNDEMS